VKTFTNLQIIEPTISALILTEEISCEQQLKIPTPIDRQHSPWVSVFPLRNLKTLAAAKE
jgi:hypothetical protein